MSAPIISIPRLRANGTFLRLTGTSLRPTGTRLHAVIPSYTPPEHAYTPPKHSYTPTEHSYTPPEHTYTSPEHAYTTPNYAEIQSEHVKMASEHADTASGRKNAASDAVISPEFRPIWVKRSLRRSQKQHEKPLKGAEEFSPRRGPWGTATIKSLEPRRGERKSTSDVFRPSGASDILILLLMPTARAVG